MFSPNVFQSRRMSVEEPYLAKPKQRSMSTPSIQPLYILSHTINSGRRASDFVHYTTPPSPRCTHAECLRRREEMELERDHELEAEKTGASPTQKDFMWFPTFRKSISKPVSLTNMDEEQLCKCGSKRDKTGCSCGERGRSLSISSIQTVVEPSSNGLAGSDDLKLFYQDSVSGTETTAAVDLEAIPVCEPASPATERRPSTYLIPRKSPPKVEEGPLVSFQVPSRKSSVRNLRKKKVKNADSPPTKPPTDSNEKVVLIPEVFLLDLEGFQITRRGSDSSNEGSDTTLRDDVDADPLELEWMEEVAVGVAL